MAIPAFLKSITLEKVLSQCALGHRCGENMSDLQEDQLAFKNFNLLKGFINIYECSECQEAWNENPNPKRRNGTRTVYVGGVGKRQKLHGLRKMDSPLSFYVIPNYCCLSQTQFGRHQSGRRLRGEEKNTLLSSLQLQHEVSGVTAGQCSLAQFLVAFFLFLTSDIVSRWFETKRLLEAEKPFRAICHSLESI